MKTKRVEFYDNNGNIKVGVITDKVKVMPVGGSASFTNYIIVEHDNTVHTINPLSVKRIVPSVIDARDCKVCNPENL